MAKLFIRSNYTTPDTYLYILAIQKVYTPSIRDLLDNSDTDTSFIRDLLFAICATEKKIRIANSQIILLKNLRGQMLRRQAQIKKVWRRAFRDINRMKKLTLGAIQNLHCSYWDAQVNLHHRLLRTLEERSRIRWSDQFRHIEDDHDFIVTVNGALSEYCL